MRRFDVARRKFAPTGERHVANGSTDPRSAANIEQRDAPIESFDHGALVVGEIMIDGIVQRLAALTNASVFVGTA